MLLALLSQHSPPFCEYFNIYILHFVPVPVPLLRTHGYISAKRIIMIIPLSRLLLATDYYGVLWSTYSVLLAVPDSPQANTADERTTALCSVRSTEYTYSNLVVQYVHPEYSDIRKRKGTILSLSAPSTLDCWSISNDEIHTTIVPLHVNRFLTNRI